MKGRSLVDDVWLEAIALFLGDEGAIAFTRSLQL
jgi:hypothetical protein